MQGHYKNYCASTGMRLFYVSLLLDTLRLLWAYQAPG